jgi:hypothetical protein
MPPVLVSSGDDEEFETLSDFKVAHDLLSGLAVLHTLGFILNDLKVRSLQPRIHRCFFFHTKR